VLNLKQTSFTEGVEKCFGKEGFQAGFEAAGVQSSLDVLIENVEKGGDVIIVGVYSKNPVVNMYYVGEHELNLFGSMMYLHEDYLLAVDLIASGKIKTMPLITDRFPFEKYREAYQYIESRGDKTLKVIIEL
jgi:L-iditol 2-dehydrogenase/threonine 3-dehydrogenase